NEMDMARMTRIAWLLAVASVASCATVTRTSIQTSWSDQTYTGEPFRRLAVLALFDSEAESRSFEQTAAEALQAEGIEAVQGHQFLDPRRDYTEAEMESALEAAEADALLIFRLIAVDERQVYRPPTPFIGSIPPAVMLGSPYYWYYYP